MLASDQRLREALSGFLSGSGLVSPVREEIVASWRRTASSGLEPEHFDVPYDPDLEQRSRLERASAPVIDQVSDDLAGTETSLLLTDDRAHVVDRRVSDPDLLSRLDRILLAPGFYYGEEQAGTNGIGTALAQRGPAFVRGGEHFADALTDMACAGAPIADPRNGQVLGVIDVTCSIKRANPLMLPLAKRAAWEIEQRLLDGTSAIERALHEHFLRARRRAKGPLAVVGEYTMMTNAAAARILDPADQARLWQWGVHAIARGEHSASELSLTSGAAMIAECEPVHDGGVMIGAVIRFLSAATIPSGVEDRGPSYPDRSAFGWTSLTETERSVAELVAEGLTNREAATRLLLSPHTVDTHLRHIFRKLDIRSRVELARLVAEHSEQELTAGSSTR